MDSGASMLMTIQEHKKDILKVKCFNSHNFGQFAYQFPHKKEKGRRNFEKKNTGEGSAPIQEQKKKDLLKIKCYDRHKHGHYAHQFPQKKGRKGNMHPQSMLMSIHHRRRQNLMLRHLD